MKMIYSYLPFSGFQSQLIIHLPEDVTFLSETHLLPRLREMKLRHTAQSEGHETMTQGSSDIVSQVKKRIFAMNIKMTKTVLLIGCKILIQRKFEFEILVIE